VEARVGIEPTHKGFADLSLTTWVPRLISKLAGLEENVHRKLEFPLEGETQGRNGAGDEGRTRDIDLGKVALYH
jgi:hypothetical protein